MRGHVVVTTLVGSARATKTFTDAALPLGDLLIANENAGPNCAGTNSVWLKREGDGWNLVFNEEADIWGSMYDPEPNVVEVPLALTKCDTEWKWFDVNLTERGNEGVLRAARGSQAWPADLALAQ